MSINTVGPSVHCPTAIETAGGQFFDLAKPSSEAVCLRDIATALAKTCRYSGHCCRYYSVAEHSCHVSDALQVDARAVGLMHDAAEAYVGDITRPLKLLIPQFRVVEDLILGTILEAFDILDEFEYYRDDVKRMDNCLLKAEAKILMPSKGAGWNFHGVGELHVTLQCWPWHEACEQFMSRAWACGME